MSNRLNIRRPKVFLRRFLLSNNLLNLSLAIGEIVTIPNVAEKDIQNPKSATVAGETARMITPATPSAVTESPSSEKARAA